MTTLTDRPNTALVIVDMQNSVVANVHRRDEVIANINTLVDKACAEQVPVIWVQDSLNGTDHQSADSQYVPELQRLTSEPLIHKDYGDSFEDTALEVGTRRPRRRSVDRDGRPVRCVHQGDPARGVRPRVRHDTRRWTHTRPRTTRSTGCHRRTRSSIITNMYWTWQAGPGRTASVVDTADVSFMRRPTPSRRRRAFLSASTWRLAMSVGVVCPHESRGRTCRRRCFRAVHRSCRPRHRRCRHRSLPPPAVARPRGTDGAVPTPAMVASTRTQGSSRPAPGASKDRYRSPMRLALLLQIALVASIVVEGLSVASRIPRPPVHRPTGSQSAKRRLLRGRGDRPANHDHPLHRPRCLVRRVRLAHRVGPRRLYRNVPALSNYRAVSPTAGRSVRGSCRSCIRPAEADRRRHLACDQP